MSNAEEPPKHARIVADAVADEMVQPGGVHVNVSQELIVTTEDKVRLCLTSHLKRIEAKRGWVAPAAILASVLVTLVTAKFHDFFLPAAVWEAIFYVALVLDLGWLIYALHSALKSSNVDDVVAEMKRVGAVRTNTRADSVLNVVVEGRPGWKVIGNWQIQDKEATNWELDADRIRGKDSGTALWKDRLPRACRIELEARTTENRNGNEIDVIVGDVMVLYYWEGVRVDWMHSNLDRERNKQKVKMPAPEIGQWYHITVEVAESNKCTFYIDNSKVVEFNCDLGRTWLRGRFGIAHWKNGIEFRNIHIFPGRV